MNCPSCGHASAPSYLGLVFDWRGRLVSRLGMEGSGMRPVRLPHSLMMILDALVQGHGGVVPEAVLLSAYRSGAATCDRLISKKVSFIRGAIAPLGVGIESARGKGYRLIAAAERARAHAA